MSNTPNKVLSQVNQNFSTAKAYQQAHDYAQALTYYQKALPQAQDASQKGQIEFDIALMTESSGNHVQAIPLLKAIAADTPYDPVLRAYAVQEIGTIYSTYTDRSAIAAETFTGDPYQSFLTNNDTALAYRKLYDYAVSMYPLGMSEVRIAQWYAGDLASTLQGATTTTQGKAYLATIQQSLLKANADSARMQKDAIEATDIPGILMREGLVYQILAHLDVASSQQADSVFKQALTYSVVTGTQTNFLQFYYARFLYEAYGPSRISDITQLLSVYSADKAASIHPAVPAIFLAARADNSFSSLRPGLVQLGTVDLSFKAYLIYLGWHDSDFLASTGK